MEEEKKLKLWFMVASIAVVVVGLVFVAMMIFAVNETTEAVKYDLNCTTELKKDPLNECKL